MMMKWIWLAAALALALGAAVKALASPERLSLSSLFNALVSERVAIRPNIAYGPLNRQRLDVYEAAADSKRKAIVLFFYGGGWRDGDRATYQFVGAALAAQGLTTVIADYRLFPEVGFPAFMQDAALAYGWVDAHLNAVEGNAPIILMGHSAGGYIAALLALDRRYLAEVAPGAQKPAGVVGLAGPYAFDPTNWPSTREIFVGAAADPDMARPVAFVTPEAPPMLLLRGLADETVRDFNAEELAKALRANQVEVDLRQFAGISHSGLVLALSRPLRWRAPVLRDSVAFIDAIIAQKNQGASISGRKG